MTTAKKTTAALRQFAAESPIPFRVVGNCMSPVMGHGSRIEISARRYYWPGDVVAFFSKRHGFVTHRVIGYRLLKGCFHMVTKSDRDNGWDTPVPFGQVLGRVTGGDCVYTVRHIPLTDRARALGVFFGLVVWSLAGRLRILPGRAAALLQTH